MFGPMEFVCGIQVNNSMTIDHYKELLKFYREIFSLGATPYENVVWNKSFLLELEAALRLQKPQHATDEM